jgi:hypothetical protein
VVFERFIASVAEDPNVRGLLILSIVVHCWIQRRAHLPQFGGFNDQSEVDEDFVVGAEDLFAGLTGY